MAWVYRPMRREWLEAGRSEVGRRDKDRDIQLKREVGKEWLHRGLASEVGQEWLG